MLIIYFYVCVPVCYISKLIMQRDFMHGVNRALEHEIKTIIRKQPGTGKTKQELTLRSGNNDSQKANLVIANKHISKYDSRVIYLNMCQAVQCKNY